MDIDYECKKGAKAYLDGKKESANPYNAFTVPKKYYAWQLGYRIEMHEHEKPILASSKLLEEI